MLLSILFSRSSYAHSYDDGETFWVHWFVTEDTISKKYLQITPMDYNTEQYYAYWKTKEKNDMVTDYKKVANQFEIAGVLREENDTMAFVKWNYTAEIWPFNLIREYNWPDFVTDKWIHLPYNSTDRILTARVWEFSWWVTINWSDEDIDSIELRSWDEIDVSTWWTASIYFSDGSKSILWDDSKNSKLILSNMDLKKKDNLITRVKLVLWGWTIWNKATSLSDDSEFEIYTTDSIAAVRWTVFWVNKSDIDTDIIVKEWKVEIAKVTNIPDVIPPSEQLKELDEKVKDETVSTEKIVVSWVTVEENGKTFIDVWTWTSKWVSVKEVVTDNIPNPIVPVLKDKPYVDPRDTQASQSNVGVNNAWGGVVCVAWVQNWYNISSDVNDWDEVDVNKIGNVSNWVKNYSAKVKCVVWVFSVVSGSEVSFISCNSDFHLDGSDVCVANVETMAWCTNPNIEVGNKFFASCDLNSWGMERDWMHYFSFDEWLSACPSWYRVPTKDEWTNAKNHPDFANLNLLGKGYLKPNQDASWNITWWEKRSIDKRYYWSDTERNSSRWYFIYINENNWTSYTNNMEKNIKNSIRCIK